MNTLEQLIPATVGAVEGKFGRLLEQGWELTAGGKRGKRFARLSPPSAFYDRGRDVTATANDLFQAFNLLHKNCVAKGLL